MRAAHAAVLREADPAVGRELARFDLANGCFDQSTETRARCSSEIVAFRYWISGRCFPHEHHKRHIGDSADPGIADQLWIERQQAVGLFRVAARRGLPVDEAPLAVEFADGVDVGNEFVASGKLPSAA